MSGLDGFEAFVSAVEEGSVARGAIKLGVSRPTLSRQLTRLEQSLGVRLLHRSTRRLTLTGPGEEFYERARRAVEEGRAARAALAVADGVPRGLVRLSVPGDLGGAMSDVLLAFMDRYPLVQLEVAAGARYVDLVQEGFDLALRAGTLADDGLIVRRLRTVALRAYASPAYLSASPALDTVDQLDAHRCIRMFAKGTVPQTHWPLLDGGEVPVRGPLSCNTLSLIAKAVQRGKGVGLLPFAPQGTVPVLPRILGQDGHLSLVYPNRRLLQPKVRVLIDHLVEHRDVLAPMESPPESTTSAPLGGEPG